MDGIGAGVLKETMNGISEPLSYLYNLSVPSGVFPDDAKISLLCPILKKGDPREVSNYRPISLLSNISKIFEKLMKSRLLSFLEKNRLLSDNQFGFRNYRNTEGASQSLSHRDWIGGISA
jgi:hypothetical protein